MNISYAICIYNFEKSMITLFVPFFNITVVLFMDESRQMEPMD